MRLQPSAVMSLPGLKGEGVLPSSLEGEAEALFEGFSLLEEAFGLVFFLKKRESIATSAVTLIVFAARGSVNIFL